MRAYRKPTDTAFFFAVFSGIFAIWFLYFLLEFPGSVNYDFASDFHYILRGGIWWNWDPIAYQALAVFLVQVLGGGRLWGYVLFQMLCCCAVLGLSLLWLRRQALPRYVLGAGMAWALVHPVMAYSSIYCTEDALFSALVLLLTLRLAPIALGEKLSRGKPAALLGTALPILLLPLIRNNGVGLLLGLLPCVFFLVPDKVTRRWLYAMLGSGILLFAMLQFVVFPQLHIWQTPITEALAIPLQQVGRVIAMKHSMTPEQAAYLNNIMPLAVWKNVFSAHSVDPVKFDKQFHGWRVDMRFFRIWLGLGLRHPWDYIRAFLDQTVLLWKPLRMNVIMRNSKQDWSFFGEKTVDVFPLWAKRSVWPAAARAVYTGWYEAQKWLPMFFSPPLLHLATLVMIVRCFMKKQRERLLAFVPLVSHYFFLAAMIPAVAVRYIYPLYFTLPVLLGVFFAKQEEGAGKSI